MLRSKQNNSLNLARPINLAHPLNVGLAERWQAVQRYSPLYGAQTKLVGLVNLTKPSQGTNGTLNGSLAWNRSPGKPGIQGALSGYAGGATTTTFVDCTNATILNPTANICLAAWVYPTSLNAENWVIARDDSTLGRSYAFGFNNSGNLVLQINGSVTLSSGTADIVVNKWQFMSCFGGVTPTFAGYVNGVQTVTGASAGPNSTTGSTTIGERTFAANQNGMVGLIAMAAVWNCAFSVEKILFDAGQKQLYHEELQGCPNILNWTNTRMAWNIAAATRVPYDIPHSPQHQSIMAM